MKTRSFGGGIHPPDKKTLSRNAPIEVLPAGERLVLPLHQHLGAPAEPLVKKGDRVFKGQKIGAAKGFVSVPVHASVSGRVRAVGNYVSPMGRSVLSVTIENDGEDELFSEIRPLKNDVLDYTPEEVRSAVREAGIVGLGGAAFPTAVKLSPPEDYPTKTLIINGAECEPYLTADYRLMLEEPDTVLAGAQVIAQAVGAGKIFLAIEDNKEDAIGLFEKKLKGRAAFEVVALKTKYPQGYEKALIKTLLGMEVPKGGLPLHVGVLVQNVGTTCAVYQTLKTGLPLIERCLTVTGEGIRLKKNLKARIGTLFRDIITYCGGYAGNPGKLIMGGPMMGISQWTDEVPVVKGTSGILVIPEERLQTAEVYNCIHCTNCSTYCPMHLVPTRLATLTRFSRLEDAQAWGLMDCMECGTCSYVCPANIPLAQWMRTGKSEVLRRKAK
jgi:electron transport complex protein RnfC